MDVGRRHTFAIPRRSICARIFIFIVVAFRARPFMAFVRRITAVTGATFLLGLSSFGRCFMVGFSAQRRSIAAARSIGCDRHWMGVSWVMVCVRIVCCCDVCLAVFGFRCEVTW